jgi:hypothetical protein
MYNRHRLGKVGQLELTADRTAAGGLLLLWAIFSALGLKFFRLRPGAALTGGFLAAALHFLSELWHQSGHARAAEQTGYPMQGVHLRGVLGASLYPDDEPPLPGEIHVERALGGPKASALLAAAGGLLALVARPNGGIAYMVAALLALENLLIFTLGAFIPLPFFETDGETLRRYLRSHRKRMVVVQE